MNETMTVAGLRFSYGEKEVLKGLSFEIRPGEILGVLGPNASGKTTLIKNLAGLLSPRGGSVLIGSRDLGSLRGEEKARRIAFVPQEEEVFLSFSVEQVVMMGRFPYLGPWGFESGDDRRKTAEAMESTDVFPLRNRLFHDLSGGERRRVILARALAQEAPLLLMDEPTSHLDVHYQLQILELCARLNRDRGLTILLSLHDINLACLYAHRLLLLKDGSLFALGRPREVITGEIVHSVFGPGVRIGFQERSGLPYTLPQRL